MIVDDINPFWLEQMQKKVPACSISWIYRHSTPIFPQFPQDSPRGIPGFSICCALALRCSVALLGRGGSQRVGCVGCSDRVWCSLGNGSPTGEYQKSDEHKKVIVA